MSKKRIKRINEKELRGALSQLPVIIVGAITEDHQIIEGNEEGAHYKITKETTSQFPDFAVYMLSVSGPSGSRLNLIAQFIEMLGLPLKEFQIKDSPHIDYICWDAKKVDKETEAVF